MRRKRKGRDERSARHSHDRWLITYADLITLLMIFFVVLYTMSRIDAGKYEVLARSLHLQFRHAESALELGDGVLDETAIDIPRVSPSPDIPRIDGNRAREEQEFQETLRMIQTFIRENNLETDVTVGNTPAGLAIRLSDRLLFDLGSAVLRESAYPVLDKLSELFAQLEEATISIQGHTDDLPVLPGSRFRDNWELSAGRALSVLRYFVDVKDLDERRFEVAGYADTRPVVPNTSAENRQQNRRVEIIVQRQFQTAETV
jgi:chemotaxis protein MotB